MGGSFNHALADFSKKFRDKTGLTWDDRNQPGKPKKYIFIERSYEPDTSSEDDDALPGGQYRRLGLRRLVSVVQCSSFSYLYELNGADVLPGWAFVGTVSVGRNEISSEMRYGVMISLQKYLRMEAFVEIKCSMDCHVINIDTIRSFTKNQNKWHF